MADEERSPLVTDLASFFSPVGGRVNRNLERLRLAKGDRLHAGRVAMALTAAAWLPLLLLAIVEGVAWGSGVQVPLLRDFLPYGQFVVAIPVLVFGEVIARRRLGSAIAELRGSGVLPPDSIPALDSILRRALGLGRGRLVDLVILVLTMGAAVISLFEAKVWLTGGWQVAGDGMTMAGWWYLLVSLPVMRFLALRWLWRAVLWAWVLWRVARLELLPKPMHPDRAGGLAFLGEAQASFGVLVFAFGVQLSCLAADSVVFRGVDLMAYRGQLVAFLVTSVLVLLLPLLVFTPKLTRARDEHLVVLSGHGYRGAEYVGRRLESGTWGSDVPTVEISGLTDFGALYENARLMRPVPIDLRDVIMLVLAAVTPFLPLIFLVMPAREVVRALASLLV
jgi:hypothetical protein